MKKQPPALQVYGGPSTRGTCPGCRKPRQFAFYIDPETGERIADNVGRCNRQDQCGYHYTPAQYFADTQPLIDNSPVPKTRPRQPIRRPAPVMQRRAYIPTGIFLQSLQQGKTVSEIAAINGFVKYLLTLFPSAIVAALVAKYFIGTSKRWPGAAVFWFITAVGNIKAGQIKSFEDSGHTASYTSGEGNKRKCTDWIHSAITANMKGQILPDWLKAYNESENKVGSLYGEHLINKPENKHKVIAMCEAPKTAIIASVYLPQFVWVACGALDWFTEGRCQALRGRRVALFPDLSKDGSAFAKWSARSKELAHIASFTISDLLERKASDAERAAGLDLADYLTRFDYREFITDKKHQEQPVNVSEPLTFHLAARFFLPDPAFAGIELGTFYLSDGRIIDCLLDANEDFLTEETDQVKQIAREYSKTFRPGTMYGHPCLIHSLN